jgi:hypothetical protein
MRAVIRAGSVTLVPAEFATVRGGPGACLARAALDPGVSLADLEFGDEDEDDELEAELEVEDAPVDHDEAEDRDLEVRFLANDVPLHAERSGTGPPEPGTIGSGSATRSSTSSRRPSSTASSPRPVRPAPSRSATPAPS